MRKLLLLPAVLTIITAAGCASQDSRDVYKESGSTINVNNKRTELYNESESRGIRNVSNNYGYVRHQKSPILGDMNSNNYYTAINREQLANIISTYSSDIPNVHDVATLVTDQEVLIAYVTDSNNRNLTADQVKKTAMSVVPRYYHVYVTDNKPLMKDVESLSHLDSTNRNARSLVKNLITTMKKSPQGQRMNASENENGETPDDMNRGMGK